MAKIQTTSWYAMSPVAGDQTDLSAGLSVPLASAVTARTTGSGASSAAVVTGLGIWRTACLVLAVTTTGTGGTSLGLVVQGSADAGTTWFDVVSFNTSVPADNAATLQVAYLSEAAAVTTVPAKGLAAALAAGTQRPGAWGDRLRIFEVVTGTYSPAAVYTLTGFFKR